MLLGLSRPFQIETLATASPRKAQVNGRAQTSQEVALVAEGVSEES